MFQLKESLLARNYSDQDFYDLMPTMPAIQFPAHWFVKLLPPISGAPIRFRVSIDDFKNTDISTYFDAKDVLGVVGAPYWEIYPDAEGDNSRFLLNDIKELLEALEVSLQAQLQNKELE